VVLAGRRKEPLEATALEVGQANYQTLVVPADVKDPASVRELFAKTKDAFGRLDLLFNNAGISGRAMPLEDLTYVLYAGSIQNHEDPGATRRAHHQ
jgi:NAD(P)-dependent dehydrogenase (short-subunit alcohol dehydrogenase family)